MIRKDQFFGKCKDPISKFSFHIQMIDYYHLIVLKTLLHRENIKKTTSYAGAFWVVRASL